MGAKWVNWKSKMNDRFNNYKTKQNRQEFCQGLPVPSREALLGTGPLSLVYVEPPYKGQAGSFVGPWYREAQRHEGHTQLVFAHIP